MFSEDMPYELDLMANIKSIDELSIIAALLHDVLLSYGSVFTHTRVFRLTCQKINRRTQLEGMSFLTKTLPKIGKAFDKALAEVAPLDCTILGLKPWNGTKLPKLFGELFSRVLDDQGKPLPNPCVHSIRNLRQLLFVFYKYELPYSDEQEQHTLAKFLGTERELETVSGRLCEHRNAVTDYITSNRGRRRTKTCAASNPQAEVTRKAQILLSDLLAYFDPTDIKPRHGPGAVATRQRLWDKYLWSNVSVKLTRKYPLDAYFYASLGHVCDRVHTLRDMKQEDLPARVVLVPKDSRGPRIISCEPIEYQWIQQGVREALVRLVERHPLTEDAVFFTDQVPNQVGALYGSQEGKYATLDLNEASDRVSLELVRLLFPPHICEYLESSRSSSTELPDGLILPLWKFAPMGSSLCFPILALTTWAILAAAAPDAYTRERIHVYGDDVVVTTAYAEDAMKQLEWYGLKVNHDKSCTKGLFRESCGMDAYKGKNVTPVKLKTVWESHRSPSIYSSWIAYANNFWDRKFFRTYEVIVGLLTSVYESIPTKDMQCSSLSLPEVPKEHRPKRSRINHDLQKKEWLVWDIKSGSVIKDIDPWAMLLRFFSETDACRPGNPREPLEWDSYEYHETFRASKYTRRDTSLLVKRWR